MSRRIVRTVVQLSAVLAACFIIALFLDNRYNVLPTAIHNHLPAHHPGLVVTDVTIKRCSRLSLFSSCKIDGDDWLLLDKDLFLQTTWNSKAYLYTKRKHESELDSDDKVVTDIRVSRTTPATLPDSEKSDAKWESRPGGLWIYRSAKRHDSDSKAAVTDIDVLFGPDAVDPRPGWSIRDTPLLLDTSGSGKEAHVTVRTGPLLKHEKPIPRIRRDGKFKIMQVADLHISTGVGICRDAEPAGAKCEADPRTLEFIGKLLDQEAPDLVILSGDQVNGETAPDVQTAIFKFADLFIKRNIPYASIFGNHDDEGAHLTRWQSMAILESLPFSLAVAGPTTVSGVGNYALEVLAPGTSQHSALTLYLLDTHTYSPDEKRFPGYDWLKPDQIAWFRSTAKSLAPAHSKYPKHHMDLAFIHIPLPEYRTADPNTVVGAWRESVTAPLFNSHFTDALVEQGVLVVSCGHDHVNDYCALERSKGTSKKPELWMCYGGGAGFGGYAGYGVYHRRVRFFEVDANSARITTYKRVEYGETEKRVDEQVVVDAGRVVG